jgi:S1-C subfamily serine protease
MLKGRAKFIFAGIIILIAILSGLFVWSHSKEQSDIKKASETTTVVNLGFNYLKVTPGLSAYYNLGVNSGALVTEVIAGSQADRAGIRPGDVIVSFNGIRIEDGVSLLGMMRACPVGEKITIEVWRGNTVLIQELAHAEK